MSDPVTVTFGDLPDSARLWVFAAPRPLGAAEAELLLSRVDEFLAGWHAHGHAVVGARDFRLDQFLLLAADEEATGVSGCSIDSMSRTLRSVGRELGADLLDASRVYYRDPEGRVHTASRSEFRELVQAGAVDERTPVFDNTVPSVGALRAGRWERPLRESWHARAFTGTR